MTAGLDGRELLARKLRGYVYSWIGDPFAGSLTRSTPGRGRRIRYLMVLVPGIRLTSLISLAELVSALAEKKQPKKHEQSPTL